MDTKEKVMRRRSQDRIRGYYYKTKDELLRSDLYKGSALARRHIQRTLDVFAHLLVQADHFGQLFNRAWPERHASVVVGDADNVDAPSAASLPKKRRREAVHELCQRNDGIVPAALLVSLCDPAGRFRCQGLWNEPKCGYAADEHSINPYASREAAILFQIWNLDHGAELSRTVVPDLLRSVRALTQPDGGRCGRHGGRGREVAMLRYFRQLFTVENLRLVHIVCHDKASHAERKSDGGVLCEECDEYAAVRELCAAVDMK